VLFVHAHPDDESITTGGTIATLVDRGAHVTVLTCTRGERGEVIPPALKALEGDGPRLAERREAELAEAMRILGVRDQRFLGDPGARQSGLSPRRYLDSGMRWGAAGAEALGELDPLSLCAASVGEVAADVATVIIETGADAVVSYGADGGYGHPDHIRAHVAAQRAAVVLGVPFYEIAADPAEVQPSELLSIDVSAVVGRKADALCAHETQVTVDGDDYALSSGPRHPIATVEHFRRTMRAAPGPVPIADQGLGSRIVAYVAALALGVVVGGLGTFGHQAQLPIGQFGLPLGLIASLAIVAALLAGLRLVFHTRVAAAMAAIGVLSASVLLSVGAAGGSVLVPANPAGYTWTYGPVVIAIIVLGWPAVPLSRLRAPAARGRSAGAGRDTIESSPEPKGTPSP
jgi:N-acetyl-1-D-myo-inositol-2-amino-2-deoxy-alpha-D-glucopyranoside deacetylase